MRIFRIAIPASDIALSREFYETVLATDDLSGVHTRAIVAGAGEVTGIEKRPWGERSFYCLDPDGHRLCFVDDTTLFLGRGADWS